MLVKHAHFSAAFCQGLGECAIVNAVIPHINNTHNGYNMFNNALVFISAQNNSRKLFMLHWHIL